MIQVHMSHNAVYGWRCAEGCNLMLLDHLKDLACIEFLKIISEDGSFTEPLTVQLAPHSLCPAGIADGKMNTVRINLLPISCRYIVSQSIFVTVYSELRICGCAGGKEHYHRVIAAGKFRRFFVIRRKITDIPFEITPSF